MKNHSSSSSVVHHSSQPTQQNIPRKRLVQQSSTKEDDVAAVSSSSTCPSPSSSDKAHHHELMNAFGKASKHLIFDPKLYPTERIHCSHPGQHKVPVYMYENFVWGGYRMNLNFVESFMSLFSIHNETLNIWTALLSALVFLYLTIDVIFLWDPSSPQGQTPDSGYSSYFGGFLTENFIEKTMFVVYAVTAIVAFSASLLYHWFNSISEKVYIMLLRIDISSIGLLIGGSYYPPLYYAFYCHQNFGIFYLISISALCLSCVAMFIIPRFSREDYRQFRVAVFGFTAMYGLCPFFHVIYLFGLDNDELNSRLMGIVYMYLFYALGVLFYSTKLPERIWPGKFDIVCHSHQFWHLFVFMATSYHFYNCTLMRESQRCFGAP
ncbi:hypothetical protein C9374_011711 [Naegleria lovaniensis]|uniref:Uncharacterized protein n=1 Tax=Naegleria lovaniensis TaxID=51637 RepID=A0AA88GCA5_NAELO|nr:uncharacterized protein C9374_011711 [Naegleria lovaniensis]KAG2373826.1 hypothetical protein C9374_011711 [Naegleria lovaniensis]